MILSETICTFKVPIRSPGSSWTSHIDRSFILSLQTTQSTHTHTHTHTNPHTAVQKSYQREAREPSWQLPWVLMAPHTTQTHSLDSFKWSFSLASSCKHILTGAQTIKVVPKGSAQAVSPKMSAASQTSPAHTHKANLIFKVSFSRGFNSVVVIMMKRGRERTRGRRTHNGKNGYEVVAVGGGSCGRQDLFVCVCVCVCFRMCVFWGLHLGSSNALLLLCE